MTQIPIANSLVSAYQPTAQPTDFDTCTVGGGGWEQSGNASIGDPWGKCLWNYNGITDTSKDKWDDLTNINGPSHRTAMGSQEYGLPIYKSNGANPPLMTGYESERPSSTDKSQPTKGTSDDKYAGPTEVDSNQPQTVIGDLKSEVTVSESKIASPSSTIVCQCTVINPPAESQPTEETEGGWESVLGPIGAVGGTILLGYTGYKVVQDSGLKSKYDGRAQLNNIYATPKWQQAMTTATSACAGKVRRALGFKGKEDDDWKHPYYSEVSQGDDAQGKTGRSALSITHNSSRNTIRTGSIKRARTPLDRGSYIPK